MFNVFFFLVAILLVRIAPAKAKKYLLLVANVVFYLTNGLIGGCFLLGMALVSYTCGRLLEKKKENPIVIPCISIGFIVLLYVYHMTGAYYSLGFSFYSLMAIGYIIDVYRGKTKSIAGFVDFFLCLSFFPIIESGPIEKLDNLAMQLGNLGQRDIEDKKENVARDDRYRFILILWGYMEKVSFANIAGLIVNEVFDNYGSHSALAIILATLIYAFQLYADFDGYSNIAYGTAGLLGINVTRNFRQPYLSDSVRDFWRRWHRSLSTWLKDYIYIPLGGNRCSSLRKQMNVFVTFVVSGLWHGVGVNYLVWGALHGIYQIIEGLVSSRKTASVAGNVDNKVLTSIKHVIKVIITFILVDFAWFFFRANSMKDAFGMLGKLSGGINTSFQSLVMELEPTELRTLHLIYMCIAFLAIIIVDIIAFYKKNMFALYCKLPVVLRWSILYGLIFWIIMVAISTLNLNMSGFIYGQF